MPEGLTLFTRPGCILCAQVRAQLKVAKLPFQEVEVIEPNDQTQLLRRAGAVSFPALFLGDRYVGGFSHVVYLLMQGRLQSLVRRAEK
jgi:glutaredoxin